MGGRYTKITPDRLIFDWFIAKMTDVIFVLESREFDHMFQANQPDLRLKLLFPYPQFL